MGAAAVGLYATKKEWLRSFWLMTGLWGFVDGGIAVYAFLRPVGSLETLRDVLFFNCGLDIGYVITGFILTRLRSPKFEGFGWAIVLQGVFLLGLDVYFWWACRQAIMG